MDSVQKAKLDMYNAVVSYCNQNISLIHSLPALQTSFTSFSAVVSSITSTTQQKVRLLSGISAGKTKSRKALCLQAATLAFKVYAYADAVGNDPLKGEVKFSVSDLQRLKDVELPAACKNILKAAVDNLVALAGYNVTAATNTSFSNNIAAYEAIEPHPRNAVTQRATYNAALGKLIKTADNLLKSQMDKIMADYIVANPGFYSTYVRNRVIVDPATTATQIKGIITSDVTKGPLPDSLIEVVGHEQKASTTADGKYVIKPLPPGTHSITISKTGFKSQTVTELVVKLGRITRLNMQLSPGEGAI